MNTSSIILEILTQGKYAGDQELTSISQLLLNLVPARTIGQTRIPEREGILVYMLSNQEQLTNRQREGLLAMINSGFIQQYMAVGQTWIERFRMENVHQLLKPYAGMSLTRMPYWVILELLKSGIILLPAEEEDGTADQGMLLHYNGESSSTFVSFTPRQDGQAGRDYRWFHTLGELLVSVQLDLSRCIWQPTARYAPYRSIINDLEQGIPFFSFAARVPPVAC